MQLAGSPPLRCAGCFNQHLDKAHVDFESAFEGPQIDPNDPRRGHVDWLVLCEDCVRSAYSFLPSVRDEKAEFEAEIKRLKAELKEEQNFSQRLEDALAHRPVQRKPKPAADGKRQPRKRNG